MNVKENWGVIALLLGVAVSLLIWFRTNTKKLVGMADFSLASVKNVKLDGITPSLTVGILINNPSDIDLTVKTFVVELYRKKADGSRTMITKSAPASLKIAKNNKVVNDVTFRFSIAEMIQLTDLAIAYFKKGASVIVGNLIVVVKADVLGQYIEKEFNY